MAVLVVVLAWAALILVVPAWAGFMVPAWAGGAALV
jgi:hypothetical protein